MFLLFQQVPSTPYAPATLLDAWDTIDRTLITVEITLWGWERTKANKDDKKPSYTALQSGLSTTGWSEAGKEPWK